MRNTQTNQATIPPQKKNPLHQKSGFHRRVFLGGEAEKLIFHIILIWVVFPIVVANESVYGNTNTEKCKSCHPGVIGFFAGVVIPLIFPKLPQSSLGILRVPQEHPPHVRTLQWWASVGGHGITTTFATLLWTLLQHCSGQMKSRVPKKRVPKTPLKGSVCWKGNSWLFQGNLGW